MKNNKEDNFKKVLKLVDADKPSVDFTAIVMGAIEADIKHELALKSLLQQEESIGANFSFTANVMAQIAGQQRLTFVFKPVITKKVWGIITAVGIVFVTILFLTNQPAKSTSNNTWITDIISYTHAIPNLYLQGLIVASLLLFADYLINKQKAKRVSSAA